MLNETEMACLAGIVSRHGLVETVRAIADVADGRSQGEQHHGTYTAAEAWAIDTMRCRKFAKLLLNGRDNEVCPTR